MGFVISVSGRTCTAPKVEGEDLRVDLSSATKSCRGGYTQGSFAVVYCNSGALHKNIRCEEDGSWEPIDHAPWPQCDSSQGLQLNHAGRIVTCSERETNYS